MTAMTEDFEKLKEIDGEAGERVIENLKDISSVFAGYIIEFPFGDIYSFHSYSMISDQIQSSSMLDVRYLVIYGIPDIVTTHNSFLIFTSS